MVKEKPDLAKSFTPQYLIIHKSESRYAHIKEQLLDTSGSPAGSSCFFIKADQKSGCICRIRAGNGAVMFYEVINHYQEGISDEDIREAISDPAYACPLPGYYYLTPKIEEKLQKVRLKYTTGYRMKQKEPQPR